MKKIIVLITFLCMVFATLTGCSKNNTNQQNATAGAVTGGIIGGLAGSLIGQGTGRLVAVGVGALTGAMIGGSIGNSMDSIDCQNMNHAMNEPTNKKTYWRNHRTRSQYAFTPTSPLITVNGNPNCRKFEATAIIHGKEHVTHGITCRQADGSWREVN